AGTLGTGGQFKRVSRGQADHHRRNRALRLDDAPPSARPPRRRRLALHVQRSLSDPGMALDLFRALSLAPPLSRQAHEGLPKAVRGLPVLGPLPPWLLTSRPATDR